MEQAHNPTIEEQVQEVLDKLRPFIQRDGGDIELVGVENGVVKVRLMGCLRQLPRIDHHVESRRGTGAH